ncbi:DUF2332 domain-containing protein [Blastococcus xanthinilyticus]|uniref:DUF2332 domain-containing protein n=1 Tax=Blastococcus xanthinilyticus TaxID=1564164 RepID=A0A5S5CQ44_9ACTN|nr:DUF2332 domain-containing protein [Blastococcus xanthinilyticus]TYP82717.1 hypothetical protein BD833_11940 [Blastococcus xanthinilyticus]
MGDADRTRIAREFRSFTEAAAGAGSPLYVELAAAVAEDDRALDLLLDLPTDKQQPMLLFGAIAFLGAPPADADELRAVIRDDGDRIRETMRTRFTQTNEPARCAAVLTAIGDLRGPVGLVEVGSSAGLCLYPDRYSYEFDGRPVGPRSAVHLTCTTSGPVPVPAGLPEVVGRVGIDQNPLDPSDPDDRAWLRALVWPGPNAASRLERLDAAAALAAREPATVLTGDLVDRLGEALDLLPADCTPVVFHTAVLVYLERDRREEFAALVRSLGVRWVAQEAAGIVPGVPRDLARPDSFVLSVDGRALAVTAPHGGRIGWL